MMEIKYIICIYINTPEYKDIPNETYKSAYNHITEEH